MSRSSAQYAALLLLAACGSKTGLPEGAPGDAAVARDSPALDAAPCVPVAELCNGLDDDCDGALDESLPFGLISGPFDIAESPRVTLEVQATERGYLVAYRRDTASPDPPNLFAQPLDPDGRPVGAPVELDESFASNGPGLAPSRDGQFVVSYCRRFLSGREMGPAWLRIDADGQPLAERHDVAVTEESCVTSDTAPQMVWTGSHHLFAGITSSTRSFVFLERSGPSGERPSDEVVREDGDLSSPPRFAAIDGGYLLAVGGTFMEGLELTRWTMQGERTGGSTFMTTPMGTFLQQHRLARGADGRVLVVANNRSGAGHLRGLLAPNGDVLEEFEWVRDEPDTMTVRAVVARPGGGFWISSSRSDGLAGIVVRRLDAEGRPLSESFDLAEAGFFPELAVRAGRVLVAYYAPNGEAPTLRAATLGCVAD